MLSGVEPRSRTLLAGEVRFIRTLPRKGPLMEPFKLKIAEGGAWFHDNIKCHAACPVGTEAFKYVERLGGRRPRIGIHHRTEAKPVPFHLRSRLLRIPAKMLAAAARSISQSRSALETHGDRFA